MRRARWWLAAAALGMWPALVAAQAPCPPQYQQGAQRLNSSESIDFCQFVGKPVVVVNTASHCGFTKQFAALEALYERYRERGLVVIGVPSDDFRQEAATQEETAKVCFIQYGVSFSMTAPQSVRGRNAHPLFRYLAETARAPRWNFYKYLLDEQGNVVAHFGSRVAPDSDEFVAAVEALVAKESVAPPVE